MVMSWVLKLKKRERLFENRLLLRTKHILKLLVENQNYWKLWLIQKPISSCLIQCDSFDIRYWPSVVSRWLDIGHFFAFFMDRGQYPDILTEQALSTKDLSWPKREHFSDGTNARYPKRARMAWVASKNTGFALSFPLADSAIQRNSLPCAPHSLAITVG